MIIKFINLIKTKHDDKTFILINKNIIIIDMELKELDSRINSIENFLSSAAQFPLVGCVAGVTKVVMGVIQATIAIACAILFLPLGVTSEDSLTKYAWSHVKHGAGNIIAGTFEGIPLVGALIYFVRQYRKSDSPTLLNPQGKVHPGKDKFMPYASLIKA